MPFLLVQWEKYQLKLQKLMGRRNKMHRGKNIPSCCCLDWSSSAAGLTQRTALRRAPASCFRKIIKR